MSDTLANVTNVLKFVFLLVFHLETFIKIAGLGLKFYFIDNWNM
jgi:hypothetical protein